MTSRVLDCSPATMETLQSGKAIGTGDTCADCLFRNNDASRRQRLDRKSCGRVEYFRYGITTALVGRRQSLSRDSGDHYRTRLHGNRVSAEQYRAFRRNSARVLPVASDPQRDPRPADLSLRIRSPGYHRPALQRLHLLVGGRKPRARLADAHLPVVSGRCQHRVGAHLGNRRVAHRPGVHACRLALAARVRRSGQLGLAESRSNCTLRLRPAHESTVDRLDYHRHPFFYIPSRNRPPATAHGHLCPGRRCVLGFLRLVSADLGVDSPTPAETVESAPPSFQHLLGLADTPVPGVATAPSRRLSAAHNQIR